jgi:membrane-associated phospholipid phosphatase
MKRAIAASLLTASLLAPRTVSAQTADASTPALGGATPVVQEAPKPVVHEATEPGDVGGFLRDVAGDYTHFFSWSTAKWLGAGGLAAAAIHPADEAIRDATQDGGIALLSGAGQTYGNLSLELPLALGWWIVGHAAGSTRAAKTGRDLVRAQISAVSWTYVAKFAVNRDRPNGEARSFPSGHASSTFATAMVLQEHYGWKMGVPFFAIATYTAASRVADNKHWASDVVFGAFVGMTAGRTVTVHVRSRTASIAPLAVPGGAGVFVSAWRPE